MWPCTSRTRKPRSFQSAACQLHHIKVEDYYVYQSCRLVAVGNPWWNSRWACKFRIGRQVFRVPRVDFKKKYLWHSGVSLQWLSAYTMMEQVRGRPINCSLVIFYAFCIATYACTLSMQSLDSRNSIYSTAPGLWNVRIRHGLPGNTWSA